MKKLILFIVIMLLATAAFAQTHNDIKQKGYSYRYNGKESRTPLANVVVECVTAINPVLSDSVGEFTLSFQNSKMGDKMGSVIVKKREMMVFNQQTVDEWSIRKEPLCLIMCDVKEFERQKQELIAIGMREAEKKYSQQKAELEKRLEASQIDRVKYEAELDKAWEELDRLQKHIDKYADIFARIDESEIDTIAQQAMELFIQGKVDEAVSLFEKGDYLEKIKSDNRAIQQAELLIETAEKTKDKVKKDREQHLQSINAQIAAYKIRNEWQKAGNLLKCIADEMNTFETIMEYASFCEAQNYYDAAEEYFNKADVILNANTNHDAYMSNKGRVLCGLAGVYKETQRYEESEAVLLMALEIYEILIIENPIIYNLPYVKTLNYCSDIYYCMKQYDKSVDLCKKALSIDIDNDSEDYYHTKAELFNLLGIVYEKTQKFDESENMFLSAIELFKQLDSINPNKYRYLMAKSMLNIAGLYNSINLYDKCEVYGLYARDICQKLAEDNPDAYDRYYAVSLCVLARVYRDKHQYEDCEKYYKLALDILERLSERNPLVYLPLIGGVKQNLAGLYEVYLKRMEDVEQLDLEALYIFKHLSETNPSVYKPEIADITCNLAILYSSYGRNHEADSMFLKAKDLIQELVVVDSVVYLPRLQNVYENLSVLYQHIGRYDKSETMALLSLEIAEKLAIANPSVYEPVVAKAKTDLGTIYEYTQRYDESEVMLLSAIQIYEKLVGLYPDVFKPFLAGAYNSTATLYYFTQQYDKSADMYKKALDIFEEFTKTNHNKYDYYVAVTSYSIGLLCMVQEQYDEGLVALKRAIEVYKQLSTNNPSLIEWYYAGKRWSSYLYVGVKDYLSAYNALKEWLLWAQESHWNVPEFDVEEFCNISKYGIYNGRFKEAEQWIRKGLDVDSNQHKFNSILAISLLFQGKYNEAEQIYIQYKKELKEDFIKDFDEFESANIIPRKRMKDVERIRKIINE